MIASDQRTSSHPHLMLSPCPVTVLIPWEDDNDDQYRYGICNLRPKRKHNLHPKDYIINNSQTPTKLVSSASSGHSSSTVPCPRSWVYQQPSSPSLCCLFIVLQSGQEEEESRHERAAKNNNEWNNFYIHLSKHSTSSVNMWGQDETLVVEEEEWSQ